MQSRVQKYLGFDDKWITIIGIPLVALVVSLIPGEFSPDGTCQPSLLISSIFTICFWFVYRTIIIEYHKRFKEQITQWKSLSWFAVVIIISYVVVNAVVGRIVTFVFPEVLLMEEEKTAITIATILIILLMLAIYEGLYYYNRFRASESKRTELERLATEQSLNTLKNQVNPHFLFNSLNTLVTLIPEDEKMAVRFVQELSKTYRTILDLRDEKLITLQKELNALESYIYLLKTRFQGKIDIQNALDLDTKDYLVLPLSLQILIENAVKHNIVSTARPLQVKIEAHEGFLIISNNLQRKRQVSGSTKLGLANIKSRYDLIAHESIEIIETEDEFIVKLPLIQNIRL